MQHHSQSLYFAETPVHKYQLYSSPRLFLHLLCSRLFTRSRLWVFHLTVWVFIRFVSQKLHNQGQVNVLRKIKAHESHDLSTQSILS
jgi:hypothetical protein